MKKKCFFLVGHSNWGKSYTLVQLTGGSSRVKHTIINGTSIFVRKMSNDDDSRKLLNFVKNDIDNKNNIIIAFCPSFASEERAQNSIEILETLKDKGFESYFFILHNKYNSAEQISADEIEKLKEYGECEVLIGNKISEVRAEEFKKFIINHL